MSHAAQRGANCSRTRATPGFGDPSALTTPALVAAMRGGSAPACALSVVPRVTIAAGRVAAAETSSTP